MSATSCLPLRHTVNQCDAQRPDLGLERSQWRSRWGENKFFYSSGISLLNILLHLIIYRSQAAS